jgi:DNA-directed RNA polymerase specialized sigma24 family protein
MDQLEFANRFDRERRRLRAVAHRIVGSLSEADDAVQEGWLRLERAKVEQIDNLERWLTTIVARICLNILRDRRSRTEGPLDGFVSSRSSRPTSVAIPSTKPCSPTPSGSPGSDVTFWAGVVLG